MEKRLNGFIRWSIVVIILVVGGVLQGANAGNMSSLLLHDQSSFIQRIFQASATIITFFGSWTNWLLITLVTFLVAGFFHLECRTFSLHLYWNGIGLIIIVIGALIARHLLADFLEFFQDAVIRGEAAVSSIKGLPGYRKIKLISSGATMLYFLWSTIVAWRLDGLRWYQASVIGAVLVGVWIMLRAITSA